MSAGKLRRPRVRIYDDVLGGNISRVLSAIHRLGSKRAGANADALDVAHACQELLARRRRTVRSLYRKYIHPFVAVCVSRVFMCQTRNFLTMLERQAESVGFPVWSAGVKQMCEIMNTRPFELVGLDPLCCAAYSSVIDGGFVPRAMALVPPHDVCCLCSFIYRCRSVRNARILNDG